MITNINQRNIIRELNEEDLPDYWDGYFTFRDETPELHELTNNLLQDAIEAVRSNERPFIDSQQVIGRILIDLGNMHNFHRQFNERFPDLRPHQILGMQLYNIMVTDSSIWIYTPIQHERHMFPHATYFIPRN